MGARKPGLRRIPDARQQSLPNFEIAVVVLAVGPNRIGTYEPIADVIRDAVENAKTGEVTWVERPGR